MTDVSQGKNSVRISLALEKKFDSARLNENFTAFIFCMKNICCGAKYTETKINLKRLHRCWREGDNSGKTEKLKLAARTNLPIPITEVVFINWKTT